MAWLTCLIVGMALCCINLFLKKKGEKIYSGILFLLSLAPNIIVWSYLYLSNLYMKQDMFWVIFGTNMSESIEYFDHFINWQAIFVSFLYVLVGIFLWIKIRSKHSLSIRKYWFILLFSISIVLLGIILQHLAQAIPTFDFYKSGIQFVNESRNFQKEKERRKKLVMDIQCALPDSTSHVFVVVLGESTSTYHMSLYDYFRETNPLLEARKDELETYTDVVTPDTYTIGVMKKVLTFADHEHPEYYTQKASVVELFNAAGFETYWISNQAFLSKFGGSYGAIAMESKHVYDLSVLKKHDEIVLPYLDEVLNDSVTANKIIFIHLMGSHHTYSYRYPSEFEQFNHAERDDLTGKDFLNNRMKKTIDEYDNSVLYGDFIVNSIIDQVKDKNTSSFVLYFSDHGEEIYETRDAQGHFMSNIYPCQSLIPFILWQSEIYKESNLDLVIDTSRPYSIENVIHSLSTLSGLQYENYQSEKSIFSTEYKVPEKRMVGKEDYDREIIYKK